jgi:hypothetical protein
MNKKMLLSNTPLLAFAIMVVSIFSSAPSLAFATTAPNGLDEEQSMLDTQNVATQFVTEDQQVVGGVKFVPRWGIVDTIEANNLGILFADCNQYEFAISGQMMLQASDMRALESFAFGLPDNFMSWMLVVSNDDQTQSRLASAGVICASESGQVQGIALGNDVKFTIHNVVKQYVRIENNQIVNLNQLINIYQNLTQIAINYVNITGSNNTVTQIINQSATQLVATNATAPEQIEQIVNQTAAQVVGPEVLEQQGQQQQEEEAAGQQQQQGQQNVTSQQQQQQGATGGGGGGEEEGGTTTTTTEEEEEETDPNAEQQGTEEDATSQDNTGTNEPNTESGETDESGNEENTGEEQGDPEP